ncbi:MAG: mechanosensitive ion channel family protein [Planctomycetia bacterium]|nr:mechanosensitive ion channel family protein [Planctomycetia bacterium]
MSGRFSMSRLGLAMTLCAAWTEIARADSEVSVAALESKLATGLNQLVLGNELYRYGAFLAAILAASMIGEAVRALVARTAARLRGAQRTVPATILEATVKYVHRAAILLGACIGLQVLNLQYRIWNNSVQQFIAVAFTIYLATVIGAILQFALARLGAVFRGRNRSLVAATCDSVSRSARFGSVALGLYLGHRFLTLSESIAAKADKSFLVLTTLVGAYIAWRLVDVAERWLSGFTRMTNSRLDDMILPVAKTLMRSGIAFATFVKIANDTHQQDQITPILAGVSVGGLAVGLAAQESIKNFFGSIMIFSDRPFELGDLIRVDSQEGRVEAVGFRSTRLRTIEGHLVTIPNGDLAGKTILNIAKRPHLRRQLNLRLHAHTAPEKVERAVEIVREILADHEGMDADHPPQVTFNDIQETALNIQVTYYFPPQEGGRFSAFSERVNFEIIRRFHAHGIELAAQRQAA